MAYYRYHVFFCTNLRTDGSDCCQRFDAQGMRDYAKQRSKQLGIAGRGGVRINSAGCLDRCAQGVTIVVYPEAVWYGHVTVADVDELFDRHVIGGEPVERLRIDEPS